MKPAGSIRGLALAVAALCVAWPAPARAVGSGPVAHWQAGPGPRAILLVDVDADADSDVVVVNQAGAAVLVNDGPARFLPPAPHPAGLLPVALFAGDFDLDGDPDLAIADSAGNGVHLLFGAAGAGFDPAVFYPTGAGPHAVGSWPGFWGVAPGLVTANAGAGSITVYEGDGSGVMFWRHDWPAGAAPRGVAGVDFNRDGLGDVVVANGTDPGRITLLAARYEFYDRYYYFEADTVPAPARPGPVALVDLGYSGWLDLIAASAGDGAGVLSVWQGDGQTPFLPRIDVPAGVAGAAFAAGDLDGDLDLDVVVADGTGGVSVMRNDAGSFTLDGVRALNEPVSGVALGDVDGDGDTDIVAALSATDRIVVLHNETVVAGAPLPRADRGALDVFPNPARVSLAVRLDAGLPPGATLAVVDVSGRLVRDLGAVPQGARTRAWDLADAAGRRVPAGVYFVGPRGAAAAGMRRVVVLD